MHIEEHRKPGEWRGYVHLILDDPETGEVVWQGKNTITFDARKIMAALLGPFANATLSYTNPDTNLAVNETQFIPRLDYLITQVAWGDGGTTDAVRTDTALAHQVTGLPATPVAFPVTIDDTSVTFQSSINPGEGPLDQIYNEVGLMARNGRLFARFVFPSLQKFTRLRLSVRWQIFFA